MKRFRIISVNLYCLPHLTWTYSLLSSSEELEIKFDLWGVTTDGINGYQSGGIFTWSGTQGSLDPFAPSPVHLIFFFFFFRKRIIYKPPKAHLRSSCCQTHQLVLPVRPWQGWILLNSGEKIMEYFINYYRFEFYSFSGNLLRFTSWFMTMKMKKLNIGSLRRFFVLSIGNEQNPIRQKKKRSGENQCSRPTLDRPWPDLNLLR